MRGSLIPTIKESKRQDKPANQIKQQALPTTKTQYQSTVWTTSEKKLWNLQYQRKKNFI